MDEQIAVSKLKKGDLAGLEFLVDQYQVLAVHAAFLITGDRMLAEDVAQSAFLKAAERIRQYDSARPFRPWFLRLVVNDSLKAVRRQHRLVPLEPPGGAVQRWLLDPQADPEQAVEGRELKESVRRALDALPPDQRAVIVQRHFLDMSESEMARAGSQPASTIKWRLHAARRRLRRLLKTRQDVPPHSDGRARNSKGEPDGR